MDKYFEYDLTAEFTIHYGEIKTSCAADPWRPLQRFTIHYGEIKTGKSLSSILNTSSFTIHYGEIKTTLRRLHPSP